MEGMENYDKIVAHIKEKYFPHHCPETSRLNNGSFGSAPNVVIERKNDFFYEYEKQADDFYFNKIEKNLAKSRARVAQEINCSVDEVVMTDNATMGSIIVAQKVMFNEIKRQDKSQPRYVLYLSIIYNALRNVVEYYLKPVGLQTLVLSIPFPLQNSENETANELIIRRLDELLQSVPKGSVALAILDHISSCPSILLPINDMVKKCKEYEVEEVFVDGAHSIGQVPLDMQELGADSFTSNIHKWSFGVTSCAFFYSKIKGDDKIIHLNHPLTSHNLNEGLARECAWIGTRDYSSQFCAIASLDFYHSVGLEIYEMLNDDQKKEFDQSSFPKGMVVAWFNRTRLIHHAKMLADYWKTSIGLPEEMITSLVMIELPNLNIHSVADASAFRTKMRVEQSIESVYVYNDSDDKCYLRLSSQIYNSSNDVIRLRDAITKYSSSLLN